MDKQLIDIVSIVLGGAGLTGAITKFNSPNSHKTYYGENLHAFKADIIDGTTTWSFTLLAVLGLVPTLLTTIYGDAVPNRLFSNDYYLRFAMGSVLFGVVLSGLLILLSRKFAKMIWFPAIVLKLRPQYLQAVEIYAKQNPLGEKHARSKSEQRDFELMTKIIIGIERYLEIEDSDKNWGNRLNLFSITSIKQANLE